jgi:hypothetical protein
MNTPKHDPAPAPKPSSGSDHRRRALTVLAGSPDGCTEALLMAHGFTTALLADLVRDGFVTATMRLRITERAGRR